MTIITPIRDDTELVPYFLRYYRRIGATRIVFVVWNGSDNPVWKVLEDYEGIELFPGSSLEREYHNAIVEARAMDNFVLSDRRIKYTDWICVVDLDEFLDVRSLTEVADKASQLGYDGVHGLFVDRVSADYTFPMPDGKANLDDLFPMISDITYVIGANPNKVCLMTAGQTIFDGHHKIDGAIMENGAPVHHFKWRSGLHARLIARSKQYKAQELAWAGESDKILKVLEDKQYLSDPIYNPRLSHKIGI